MLTLTFSPDLAVNLDKKENRVVKRLLCFGSPNWARTSDIMINSHALSTVYIHIPVKAVDTSLNILILFFYIIISVEIVNVNYIKNCSYEESIRICTEYPLPTKISLNNLQVIILCLSAGALSNSSAQLTNSS